MSTRRSSSRFVVAFASATLLACGGAFAMSACSSSTTETGTGADATTAPDARITVEAGPDPVVDSSTPVTPEQCEAKCKADHPAAVAKSALIDSCWSDKCQGACLDETGYDAGADAAVDAGMLCGTDTVSGDDSCDQCTAANCCTSWAGCFGDPDCSAYDKCIGDCNP